MRQFFVATILLMAVQAFSNPWISIHNESATATTFTILNRNLERRGAGKRPTPKVDGEVSSHNKRMRPASSQEKKSPRNPGPNRAASPQIDPSQQRELRHDRAMASSPVPDAGAGRSSNPEGSKDARSPNASSPRSKGTTSRGRTSSIWSVSTSSSSRGSVNSDSSEPFSSPATSQHKRYPVSVSTMTTGPAEIRSYVGRTRGSSSAVDSIPPGKSVSMAVSHPKKALMWVDHLGEGAHTYGIAHGRNARIEGSNIPESRGKLTAIKPPHKGRPLEIKEGGTIAQETFSKDYRKAAKIMGSLEGAGQLRIESQNSPWHDASI